MKTYLLIAIVVGMCDSCESKYSEQSRFRSFGRSNGQDATMEYGGLNLNSGDPLPEYERPKPQIKFSGNVNEQVELFCPDSKIYYYSIN